MEHNIYVVLDDPFFPNIVYLKRKGMKNIKDVNLWHCRDRVSSCNIYVVQYVYIYIYVYYVKLY